MMKLGLLWFDDDAKRKVVEKLDEAAERYEERFGVWPTLVHLNPAQAEGLAHRRLRVYGDTSLRRNYFLVGVDADAPVEQVPAATAAAVAAPGDEAPPRRRAARARAVPSLAEVSNRHPRARRRVS